MKLILHGMFARDYGPSFEIEATSPADAIEGFSRQLHFYDDRILAERPLVSVVGYETEADLKAECAPDTELHLVPAMYGGGGNFGRILLGVVLVAAAFLPFGGVVSTWLMMTGFTLILSGVMGLFTKAPSTSKSADPPASKYLGSSSMTTAIGTLHPYCLGRTKLSGQVLSYVVSANSLTTCIFPASPT